MFTSKVVSKSLFGCIILCVFLLTGCGSDNMGAEDYSIDTEYTYNAEATDTEVKEKEYIYNVGDLVNITKHEIQEDSGFTTVDWLGNGERDCTIYVPVVPIEDDYTYNFNYMVEQGILIRECLDATNLIDKEVSLDSTILNTWVSHVTEEHMYLEDIKEKTYSMFGRISIAYVWYMTMGTNEKNGTIYMDSYENYGSDIVYNFLIGHEYHHTFVGAFHN